MLDTGFGGVLNVHRTVRQPERAGAAAVQLEDQISPKRCGHFDGKAVVAQQTMLDKPEAALDSSDDPDLVIIARTAAYAAEGFEASVERVRAYAEASVDMIFVEAPRIVEELRQLPTLIDAPLVANMVEGGKTPLLTVSEPAEVGFRIELCANTALRVAMAAVQRAMETLRNGGGNHVLLADTVSWDERQRLVGLERYQQLEDRYLHVPSR